MNSTVKVLLLIVCVLMYASIARCASVSRNSIEENQTDIHSIPSNYQLAECKCTGGKCVFENGEEFCKCPPEYGVLDKRSCKACECGEGSNCTFTCSSRFSCKEIKKCICKEGYEGKSGKCVAGPCSTKPCQNGGTCTVDGQSFKCDCKPPFTGNTCEIGPCSSNPCQNEGTCAVEGQSFKCECKSPFSGKNCETECDCKNGKCRVTENNKVICECLPEYGKYDDVCTACDCGTGANCTFDVGFFSTEKYCLCPDGRKLKNQRCEDPCNNSPCKNGGTCKVEGKKFKCACKPPYLGDLCERDLCSENPCKNSGTCKISGTTFQCNCKQPYSGELCEKDPCTDNPCKNGGTCKREKNSFKCTCRAPFYGDTCEKDPCTVKPCKNGGTCRRFNNSFNCTCKTPFYGDTCEKELTTVFTSTVTKSVTFSTTKRVYPSTSTATITNTALNITTPTSLMTTKESPETTNFKNVTSFTPKNFTYTSFPTSEPSNFTNDFNETDQPSNFTDSFNWTTYGPSNFTRDFNTTDWPSNFTYSSKWTTYEPSNFTRDFNETDQPSNYTNIFNLTTYEPSNFTAEQNMTTYEPSNVTSEVNLTTITKEYTVIYRTTATTKKPGVCDNNPCKNGGTCIETKEGAKCKCTALYDGETCTESYWCNKGEGKSLCQGGTCVYDFKSKLGRCTCPKDQFYNYEKKQCQVVDRCPFLSINCTGQFEVCKNGICQCKDNFVKNEAQKCVPNFCALNPCGENEVCEDLPTDPGNVKCSCKQGYYYDGQSCQEASLCDIPSTLSCQQICNSSTEECECHPGFALQSDNKTCKANDLTKPCKQKCGVGICVTIDSKDVCVCPSTHVAVGLSCVDLCTAKHIPTGVCPDDECAADDKMGFKCKCEGNYTYDQNGVTCRKKLMCSEGDGTKTCAKYKARCVEDFNHADGYRCECDKGQAMDNDGICKDKCEVSKQKEECDDRKATCDMDGFEAVCKCPPLLTLGSDGKCTEFAKVSYSGELPLALDRYALKKLLSPSKANLKDDTINYDAIRKDLRSSMHMMYGDNYKFADIVNCRIVDKTLKCLVEVQFQSNPEDQVKLITDASSCLSFDKNTCFIPPRLLLDKKNFKSDGFTETDPCMDDIKNLNCGPETECKKIEGKGFNYECSCSPGFESFNTYLPLSDSNTVIHHCNDINECLQQKACPNRTRCLNTYGSYECVCQNGFRPPTDKSDPKISNCVEVCHSKVCKHGKCEVLGEAFRCRCDDGYTGLDCGQAIQNMAGYEGMKSALIVLSVLVVPLMLIVAFLIHKYYVLKKYYNKTNYFDDCSSTINLQPMRTDTETE